jgi:glycine/D-amino acid oxidase-like deaminating enzyme
MTARPLPKSLYAETARPAVPAPPLEGDRKVSVAVVGGGFTGLSTALHLAQAGTDVALLESHEPGWGASGRNGGQVNPGLKHDPDAVLRDFGPEMGGRMIRLSGGAPQAVFDLVREHQIQCEAHQGGTIRAAYHDAGFAEIGAGAGQQIRHGAPVELLDAAGMQRVTGTSRYVGGLIDRRGGNVNPLGYARGLADAAQRAGAAIHGGSPVTRVMREDGRWVVTTPTGTLRAEQLVLCTNGYTDNLWPGLRRSVVPVFSAIAATEPLPEALARAIMPTRSVLYEIASITVYYRLDAWNRLLMGGRSALRDTSDPQEYSYRRLIRYSETLWPELKGVRWNHFWNGQLAITPDHYPHLHEPAPGVIAALGYNGRGVAMATAMGGQIARRILSPGAAVDMPITNLKPIPFHALWRSAVAARVTYGRIRDILGV